MTPARITEPAVGACVWASGSHVWSGKIGTFTAKAMANAKNSQRAVVTGEVSLFSDDGEVERQLTDTVVAGQEGRGDDADEHERRAEHREHEELQQDAALVTPATDEEVHRDEHDLEEDEEHEEVEAEEAAHHPRLQDEQPGEVRLDVVVGIDGDHRQREQQPGQHDEEQRDAVDAEVPGDPPLLDPGVLGDELEASPRWCRRRRASRSSAT